MEPLYRSPYNIALDEFGYDRQEGDDDDYYNTYATSLNNMNALLSSMRATGYGVKDTDGEKDDDDENDNSDDDALPIEAYLVDDREEEAENARTVSLFASTTAILTTPLRRVISDEDGELNWKLLSQLCVTVMTIALCYFIYLQASTNVDIRRPDFVNHHPYVSSSYYSSTQSLKSLLDTERLQVKRLGSKAPLNNHKFKARLAVVRPFCEFDAEALPSTFAVWNQLPPCRASATDLDLDDSVYRNLTGGDDRYFDDVHSEIMKDMVADVFLFYSQTFSENEVAIKAVDAIVDQFNEPGGWSQCFANIYAIEANIPQELDLYIPSAQEELYNWVNGPNRQFEAAFRIIQSGEWGDYDGFYLMEGDSIPIKANWLDVVLSEVEANRPFAILGAKYNGDKWDNFFEQIPLSLIHHINGNAIYNTSHPLLERLVGQLEVEAPCPYNSIPYDYRMSQMVVEGAMAIIPELAPKIMLNEEGENITLSNNTEMFGKWWDLYSSDTPFKETPVIHNYAATNLIPRHLGPEYIIHGAKLYAPWNPTKTSITLVISEWFKDRSTYLLSHLDEKDHPFSEVVVMLPPSIEAHDDYDSMTVVPVRSQHRSAPDYMDLCEAEIDTEWFMITNSYHKVASHVDLMFVPGTFKPVAPFTPATYAFCFKFPYCKESVNLAQRFNPGHEKVVLDFDILYHTKTRNSFCKEWKERFGPEGEDLYKGRRKRKAMEGKIIGPSGPTGTSYAAYLTREGKDSMYKFTDRSLYGARDPFVKVFAREERLDGLSEDLYHRELERNLTRSDCNCKAFETQEECENSGLGCIWRPLFESCRPPELIDGGTPICASSEAPTMAPTAHDPDDETEAPTDSPTEAPQADPWYASLFKAREHDIDLARRTNEKVDEFFGPDSTKDIEAFMREDSLGDISLDGESELLNVESTF